MYNLVSHNIAYTSIIQKAWVFHVEEWIVKYSGWDFLKLTHKLVFYIVLQYCEVLYNTYFIFDLRIKCVSSHRTSYIYKPLYKTNQSSVKST